MSKRKNGQILSISAVAERLAYISRCLTYSSTAVFAKQELSSTDQNMCNIFQISKTHEGELQA
jgi:hypothetical protein